MRLKNQIPMYIHTVLYKHKFRNATIRIQKEHMQMTENSFLCIIKCMYLRNVKYIFSTNHFMSRLWTYIDGSAILTFSEILTLGFSDFPFPKPFTAVVNTIVALCKIDDTPVPVAAFFFEGFWPFGSTSEVLSWGRNIQGSLSLSSFTS